jgi:hypothetical protein
VWGGCKAIGRGSGEGTAEYKISVVADSIERVTVNKSSAQERQIITITISNPNLSPEALETLSVTGEKKTPYAFKEGKTEGTYTFVMPASDVLIKATFAAPSAALAGINPSVGTIKQKVSASTDFDPDILEYTVLVGWTVQAIELHYEKAQISAQVTQTIADGKVLDSLAAGETKVTFDVLAKDGQTTKIYKVSVYKQNNPELASVKIEASDLAAPIVITNPLDTIVPPLPLNISGQQDITLTIAPVTAGTVSKISLSGNISVAETASDPLVTAAAVADGETKTAAIKVITDKGTGWEALAEYTLSLYRPDDPNAPHTAMAEGGKLRYIKRALGLYDEVHIFNTVTAASTPNTEKTLVFSANAQLPSGARLLVVGGGGSGCGIGAVANNSTKGGLGGVVNIQNNIAITSRTTNVIVGKGAAHPGGRMDGGYNAGSPGDASQFGAWTANGGDGGNGWGSSGSGWFGGTASDIMGQTAVYGRNGGSEYNSGGRAGAASSGEGGTGSGTRKQGGRNGGAGGSGIVIVRFPYIAPAP